MKQLIVFVLRLLLQLVLFAMTGRWYELGPPDAPDRPRAPRTKQPGPRRVRTFRPEVKVTRARGPRVPARGALLDLDLDLDLDFDAEGGRPDRRARVPEGGLPGRGAVRAVGRAPATSLRAALTDRRVLRDALVLGAALGPRGRRP